MARSGIDKRVIARMMRDMQREFDKHPIKIPLKADDQNVSYSAGQGLLSPATMIYNGPVFHGDANGAQLAWGNHTVNQTANRTKQVAPGFEPLAQAVVRTLEQLGGAGLPDEDLEDAEVAGNEVLDEVTKAEPDRGLIRRGLSALKGFLAPVAMGISAGGTEGAQEWAKTAIEHLGTPF